MSYRIIKKTAKCGWCSERKPSADFYCDYTFEGIYMFKGEICECCKKELEKIDDIMGGDF